MHRPPLLPLACALLAAVPACATTRADTTPAPAAAEKFAMRAYQVVVLRRGPAWTPAQTPETEAIFKGHMAHLQAQTAAGKLVLAGPFSLPADDAHRDAPAGLCVYAVDSAEEARTLAAQDPAVQAGRFTVEVLPWFGPVGLRYDGMEAFVARGPG